MNHPCGKLHFQLMRAVIELGQASGSYKPDTFVAIGTLYTKLGQILNEFRESQLKAQQEAQAKAKAEQEAQNKTPKGQPPLPVITEVSEEKAQ